MCQASIGSVVDCCVNKPSHLRVSFRAKTETGKGVMGHNGTGGSRGPSPSPLPCHRLSVPGPGVRTRPTSAHSNTSAGHRGQELYFDDSSELIRSCAALSKALGFQRSFSCGDIWGLLERETMVSSRSDSLLMSSEVDYLWGGTRLDTNSRSLSTWVAVGDVEENVNSQLPSPHVEMTKGFPGDASNTLSPADLIRSVNKNIRHNYIRRRLKVIVCIIYGQSYD